MREAVRALRDVAAEIEAELICCDVFERRDQSTHHEICYWAGAARALVLAKVDELEGA